jgi:P4 family phage/plasmid primase-like protien
MQPRIAWPPPSVPGSSDVTLAEVVRQSFGMDDLVYDREEFRWWNDNYWQRVTRDEMKQRVSGLNDVSVSKRRKGPGRKPTKLALGSSKISGVVEAIRFAVAKPGFFDNSRVGCVAFRDVTVDVSSIGLRPRDHDKNDRLQWAFSEVAPIQDTGDTDDDGWIPIESIPEDDEPIAPEFAKYLRSTFDDKDKAKLLGEWIGLTLIREITKFGQALMLLGVGSNGKSVLISVLRELFRPAGMTVVTPSMMAERFGPAELAGATVNLVDEMPADELLAVGTLKAAITGGEIKAERKNRDPFQFRPFAGHVFAMNQLPSVRDSSEGFFRRFPILEFNKKFSMDTGTADPHLLRKILAHDMIGIIWWSLCQAVFALRNGKLIKPTTVQAATAFWRGDSDPITLFLTERCERIDGPTYLASGIYTVYKKWAEERGHRPVSETRFGRRVRELGIPFKRCSRGVLYAVRPLKSEEIAAEMFEEAGYDAATYRKVPPGTSTTTASSVSGDDLETWYSRETTGNTNGGSGGGGVMPH